jgi:hypothetical protein
MYSRSAATSPYDGSNRRRVEYTCNESFATRIRFSRSIRKNFPESPAHQLPPLGFGEVRDSHSKGQLLEGSAPDMMDDSKDYGDGKGKYYHVGGRGNHMRRGNRSFLPINLPGSPKKNQASSIGWYEHIYRFKWVDYVRRLEQTSRLCRKTLILLIICLGLAPSGSDGRETHIKHCTSLGETTSSLRRRSYEGGGDDLWPYEHIPSLDVTET